MASINNYLVKAIEDYPYNLEDAVTSLEYALSQEPENPYALTMMGRVYLEQLLDFNQAIHYFEDVLASDINNIAVYPYLIRAFILNEDFDKARKLIDFAIKIKGIDKPLIYAREVWLHEALGKNKKALESLKEMKKYSCNNLNKGWIDETEQRLNGKLATKKDKSK